MTADIIFYSPSTDNAPSLSEIKQSHRCITGFLSSVGINTSSGLQACWGKMQFQQAIKESLTKSQLLIVMDSFENYPNTAKDILCRGIGCRMTCSQKLVKSLERKLNMSFNDMSEEQKNTARIPENAQVFENPVGIEPAVLISSGNQSILILPYHTDMIKALFDDSLSLLCS